MLWSVPLPNILDILKSNKQSKDNWKLKSYQEPLYFCGGAEALAFICENEQKQCNEQLNILVPSYFCGQSLRYLRGLKINIIFYGLDSNLLPNYDQLELKLTNIRIHIMLHVHYFGKISAQNNSRYFCDKNRIVLIEDCAHIIHPTVNNQWVGDYLFFSPHKHFPVKNGGILYSKNKIQINLKRDKISFPYLWFVKNIIKRVLLTIKRYNNTSNCELIFSNDMVLPNYKIPSDKEIQLLQNMTNNLDNIIKIRNNNLNKLKTLLVNYDDWDLLINFNDDIPYIVGMNCSNNNIMIELYEMFIRNNCPIMIWPDLPEELKNEIDKYEEDINRTKNTIFFFIHNQIDINKYIKNIKGVLDKLK